MSIKYFFKLWKERTRSFNAYDTWCEENFEYLEKEKQRWLNEKIPQEIRIHIYDEYGCD